MNDQEYFSRLYEIASHLNREFTLSAALRMSLQKTVELFNLETGWIWLTEPDNKSVYLAASYNLPPALSNHPERLSGWCYCIKQYLSDDIDEAMNISEITCSRLKDISTGTKNLKFHATIPITIGQQKVGLINLLSKESRQLAEKELAILNTISELIGAAIQRTRLQQFPMQEKNGTEQSIRRVLNDMFLPQLDAIVKYLEDGNQIQTALEKAKSLQSQLTALKKEGKSILKTDQNQKELIYPETPLTKRELEVLGLLREGHTNAKIGEQLYIAERTVKFHVTSIFSKLHANTRTEAVDIALKRGLLGF